MEPNAKQIEAFKAATGVNMADLSTVIASLIVIAIFLWSAWVAISHYDQWASKKNGVTLYDVFVSITRSCVILLVIVYLVS